MLRCTESGAAALGLMTMTAAEPASAPAHAGCGCSGGKSQAVTFLMGALVGAVVILALRA